MFALFLGDCDSGAQDMFGDSLTLNELRKSYPELYQFMHQIEARSGSTEDSKIDEERSWSTNGNTKLDPSFNQDPEMAFTQLLEVSNSPSILLPIRQAMSSIFDCLNDVHMQKTSKLRSEIRDLCSRLQGLQVIRRLKSSSSFCSVFMIRQTHFILLCCFTRSFEK